MDRQAEQFAVRINFVFPTLGHASYCVKKPSKTSLKHQRFIHFKTDGLFQGAHSFVTMSFFFNFFFFLKIGLGRWQTFP